MAVPVGAQICVTPPAGIAAWWKGEGNFGDLIHANSLQTGGGVTFTSGRVGQSFSFDGSTSYLRAPKSPELDLGAGAGLTIELWLRPSQIASSGVLLEWSDGLSNLGIHLWQGDNGSVFANLLNSAGSEQFFQTGSGVLIAGSYQHVALTYDKSTGVAKIFVNGVVKATGTFNPGSLRTMMLDLYMGYRATGGRGGSRYQGEMDEIALYNRALDPSEIAAIAAAGAAGKCATPTPLSIIQQPLGQTNFAGSTASFSVIASGFPAVFQWFRNGELLPQETNASLTFTNLRPGLAGIYSVTIANVLGAVISSNAPLAVVPSAEAAGIWPGLVSWWPGDDGSGSDLVGTNYGMLLGGLDVLPALFGNGFRFVESTRQFSVPASSSLDVGAGGGFTLEAWVKQYQASTSQPVFDWHQGSSLGVHLYLNNGGSLYANLVTIDGSSQDFASSTGLTAAGVYYHVALTYDRGSGDARLFLDGSEVASHNVGTTARQTSYPLNLGWRDGQVFNGIIDEPAIYNRALDPNEIFALAHPISPFNAKFVSPVPLVFTNQPQSLIRAVSETASFQVGVTGYPVTYRWEFNGAPLAGANGRTLSITNVAASQAGAYRVIASNTLGAVTSEVATLTVNVPDCLTLPTGARAWWRGENSAVATVSTNHGQLVGGAAFGSGKVGSGFQIIGSDSTVRFPAGPAINIGSAGSFSIEFWFQSENVSAARPLVEWNDGLEGIGVHAWINDGAGLLFNARGTMGQDHYFTTASGLLSAGIFHHVAFTFEQPGGLATIFLNGLPVASNTLGTFNPQTSFDLYLGRRISGGFWPSAAALTVDELTLYDRVLSPTEVLSIFQAGGAGKCPPDGQPPSITQAPVGKTNSAGQFAILTVQASGQPSLHYQWRRNGTNLPGALGDSLIFSPLKLADAGDYSVLVTNVFGAVTSAPATVVVSLSLEEALDEPQLTFLAGGNIQPMGQTTETYDGVDAVVLGSVGDLGESWFETTLTGPGTLDFAWRVSSETNWDELEVRVDGTRRAGISGETPWRLVSLDLAPGTHTVRWRYVKDISFTAGQDRGWVDKLVFTFAAAAPVFIKMPTPVSSIARQTAVFSALAKGYPTPTYQWQFNNENIPGATGTSLVLGYLLASDVGSYRIIASNSYGVVISPSVALAIGTPPFITFSPLSRTNYVGELASFNVAAAGDPTLSYQWRFNGVDIPGAVGNLFTLNAPLSADAGLYSCVVSNPFGLTESGAATLTLRLPPSLNIIPSGTFLLLRWPVTNVAFQLESSPDLSHSNWTVAPEPITVFGQDNVVIRPSLTNAEFFRLRLP